MSDNDNRDTSIVEVLVRISKVTRTVIGLRLAEIGLSTGEDDILLALEGPAPISIKALSSKISVRSPTTTIAVDQLACRGYVETIGGSLVRLTESGVEMRGRVLGVRSRIHADIARTIDIERLEALSDELAELETSLGGSLVRMT